MDKTEVKALLPGAVPSDTFLDAIIPLIIEWVQDYCNQTFEDADEFLQLPGGVKIFIARACQFNAAQAGVKSESLGDYSVSYSTEYPESLTKLLRPYRKVSWT